MRIKLSKSTFDKLICSPLIVTVVSFSLLPLSINSALGQQSVVNIFANASVEDSEIDRLIEVLQQRDIYNPSPTAKTASEKLVKIGQPAVPKLIKVLEKNSTLQTIGVAETLLQIAKIDSSVAQIMIENLGDRDSRVRFAAMLSLNDNSFEPALKTAAENNNLRVRSGAILALGLNGKKKSVLPLLNKALRDKDSSIRRSAAISLASNTEILKNALKDEDPLIRVASASVLVEMNAEISSATPVLIEALESKDSIIRAIAVEPLLTIAKTNSQVLPVIVKTVQDADSGVRYMAINGISDFGKKGKVAIPALIEALDDKNENIRGAAIYALGAMGSDAKAAKPKIIAILENERESEDNRDNAAMFLGEMGENATSAVPLLINLLEDRQNSRRLAISAALALDKIDYQVLIPSLVKRLPDREMEVPSAVLLSRIASKIKENKANVANADLDKAITQFEKALKIIDNSRNEFPQDKIKSLRESVEILKKE